MRKLIIGFILLSFHYLAIAQFDPGTIGSDQQICYGKAPIALTQTPASGGTGRYLYQWQRSINNGNTWINIYRANLATYRIIMLGQTTSFRRRVTDLGTQDVLYSNVVTITVFPYLKAGTIGNAQTIYAGTAPGALSELLNQGASGGSGSYSYRWQNSPDGLYWSDIVGATSTGYSPSAIIADTWYRRFVIDGICGTTASNTVKITVNLNPITLYTTETPTDYAYYGAVYDWGTKFRALTSGFITKVRLYSHYNESGLHQIRLWRQNDQSTYDLIAGPIDWTFSAGGTARWFEYDLPSAIAVEANRNYIVSITSGVDNLAYVYTSQFSPVNTNDYIRYLSGVFTPRPGIEVPHETPEGWFRDIAFMPFSSGTAGAPQSICYNTIPSPLNQITAPSGGLGAYSFQWQQSTDGLYWTNIQGATSQDYSPTALTISTYYRRNVTSGNYAVNGSPVLITVDTQFSLAQLHDNITIYNNTSTYLKVTISGGTPPYTIEYTRNSLPQTTITNYTSGSDIYTGLLSGTYVYALTSVKDAFECEVQSRGDPITVTASGSYSGSGSNKALVIVNSGNANYPDYVNYIKPYLDWFGIPYETCDINSMSLPVFSDYAVIIFGHRNVYTSDYPINDLVTAITSGVGLYSFDPHLFDYASAFNIYSESTHPEVTSSVINILPGHYITQFHENDTYQPSNETITLKNDGGQQTMTISQTHYSLAGGINLATMTSGATEPLLQIASFGNGRIVKWSTYGWMFDYKLGPMYGMDDLIWRGIVWAARKPFVMQGLPPMVTMRVDDVDGTRSATMPDLEWLIISNEYGFIPWCGTFIETQSEHFYDVLRYLTDNNLTTASPHAFNYSDPIFHNTNNEPNFNAADNVISAWGTYAAHSITKVSKYVIAHNYLLTFDALPALVNMGVEFIGTKIYCDPDPYPGSWLNCGPYRNLPREGYGGGGLPFSYADHVNWLGNNFFISMTEIGDDGGYEWYPNDGDVSTVIARGVRHLRRALNSMVLPTLFTHEDRLFSMPPDNWRQILSGITSEINNKYSPKYKSMDDAVQYVRAKENINILNVTDDNTLVSISCSGINDLETKCYMFTESGNQISFRLITLPRVSSSSNPVIIGVSK